MRRHISIIRGLLFLLGCLVAGGALGWQAHRGRRLQQFAVYKFSQNEQAKADEPVVKERQRRQTEEDFLFVSQWIMNEARAWRREKAARGEAVAEFTAENGAITVESPFYGSVRFSLLHGLSQQDARELFKHLGRFCNGELKTRARLLDLSVRGTLSSDSLFYDYDEATPRPHPLKWSGYVGVFSVMPENRLEVIRENEW